MSDSERIMMIFDNSQKNKFSEEVKKRVESTGETYMDSILFLCEKHEMEPEAASSLLTKPIIEKISAEAQELRLLPRKNKTNKLLF